MSPEETKETEVEQKTETDTKTAEEKTETDSSEVKQDEVAEKLGTDFDKKADQGDDHSAYTETPEEKEAKEAKAKTEAEDAEKAKADEETGKKDPEEVDDSLLERAVKAGLSLERARNYGSKEDLEHTVKLLEDSQSKAISEKGKTPEEIETEKQAKEAVQAKVKEDEAPYDCKLDPELYEEGLIKALNEQGTMLKKRIVALESGHTKHAESLKSNRTDKYTDWFDSKCNRLSDDDLKEVYGNGELDDFELDSEQFKARAALDTKITEIASGLHTANKTVPSRNKLFNLAIDAIHKGKSTTKADAKTKAKLAERAKQAVGGGSSKVAAEIAESKALKANKDFDSKLDEEED